MFKSACGNRCGCVIGGLFNECCCGCHHKWCAQWQNSIVLATACGMLDRAETYNCCLEYEIEWSINSIEFVVSSVKSLSSGSSSTHKTDVIFCFSLSLRNKKKTQFSWKNPTLFSKLFCFLFCVECRCFARWHCSQLEPQLHWHKDAWRYRIHVAAQIVSKPWLCVFVCYILFHASGTIPWFNRDKTARNHHEYEQIFRLLFSSSRFACKWKKNGGNFTTKDKFKTMNVSLSPLVDTYAKTGTYECAE